MSLDLRGPIGDCHVIDFTAVADQDAGDVVAVEDGIGFVVEDTLAGKAGSLIVKAPRIIVSKATVVVASAENAFYDSGAGDFTNVAGSNRKCGFFNEAAALNAATVEINFDGYGS